MSWLVGVVSPFEPRPDAPFFRSLVEHGPTLRALSGCPRQDVPIHFVVPLVDELGGPATPTVDVLVTVVPAFHAGFLRARRTNPTIQQVLRGEQPPVSDFWNAAGHVLRRMAVGWHMPPLDPRLVPAWSDDGPVLSSATPEQRCEVARTRVQTWMDGKV